MSLINCPECGHEMSETSKKCPNCGYKQPSTFDWRKYQWILGLSLIIIALVWMIISVCTMSDWGDTFIIDTECFIISSIMFIIGLVPLYFGCRMMKQVISRYNLIFGGLTIISLITLVLTFTAKGIWTQNDWDEYLHRDYEDPYADCVIPRDGEASYEFNVSGTKYTIKIDLNNNKSQIHLEGTGAHNGKILYGTCKNNHDWCPNKTSEHNCISISDYAGADNFDLIINREKYDWRSLTAYIEKDKETGEIYLYPDRDTHDSANPDFRIKLKRVIE